VDGIVLGGMGNEKIRHNFYILFSDIARTIVPCVHEISRGQEKKPWVSAAYINQQNGPGVNMPLVLKM
jgi:hypothetical protein